MTDILDTEEVLCREFAEIERRRGGHNAAPGGPDILGESAAAHAQRLELTALCLSGGGIRSAAFCLGVIQALAAKNLLNAFDYVSSVSGGGYVSGWLQVLLRAHTQSVPGDVAAAIGEIGSGKAGALRRLRGFTNFLTPQTGPFSSDTWAGIMLYLRNLILTWSVLLPLLLLVCLLPVFYPAALFAVSASLPGAVASLLAGAVALTVAAWRGCALLPSHRMRPGTPNDRFATPTQIRLWVVVPACAWAFLVPFAVDYGLSSAAALAAGDRAAKLIDAAAGPGAWPVGAEYIVAGLYAVCLLLGYGIAWSRDEYPASRALYRENWPWWTLATAAAALLTLAGLWLIEPGGALNQAARISLSDLGISRSKTPLLVDRATALAAVLPVILIGMHVLQTTFYVGLRHDARFPDLDREWLARLSGVLMRFGVAWAIIALCCLVLPQICAIIPRPITAKDAPSLLGGLLVLLGGSAATGGPAAWLGKLSAANIDAVSDRAVGRFARLLSGAPGAWLLNLLAVAFAILLLGFGTGIVDGLLAWPQLVLIEKQWLSPNTVWAPVVLQLTILPALAWIVWTTGSINTNRFSMHAVYRNRLARAFLGTARAPAQRHPDAFTGFDLGDVSTDNPRLAEFANPPPGQRLFPVINMTLNVTAGRNTAWAERKGECFIATPLACGAAELRHPDQAARGDAGRALGAYVATPHYAGMETSRDRAGDGKGLRLGSAITISGAAISPNWGYHSSRPTALLMTAFNVRLGAWLPNPAVPQSPLDLQRAGPRHSLRPILGDALGMTSDDRQAIYLSDGGHFENLALYEMLRRRCRHILVIDAGQDAACAFADLSNAIRKAEVDLNVRITMRPMHIYSRSKIETTQPRDAMGFAFGDIDYSRVDGADPAQSSGRLIYVKPTLLQKAPVAVRGFADTHPSFPHVSTLDQWFTEDEFESYRTLGAWQMQQVMEGQSISTLQDLFDAADRACPP